MVERSRKKQPKTRKNRPKTRKNGQSPKSIGKKENRRNVKQKQKQFAILALNMTRRTFLFPY